MEGLIGEDIHDGYLTASAVWEKIMGRIKGLPKSCYEGRPYIWIRLRGRERLTATTI